MGHYDEQREQWYKEDEKVRSAGIKTEQEIGIELQEVLIFDESPEVGVYASLESLEGVVELGCGVDKQGAREAYVLHIDNLIHELQEKKVKIMYEVVKLDYMSVKEV